MRHTATAATHPGGYPRGHRQGAEPGGLRAQLAVEYAKMRRLRVGALLLGGGAAVVLLSAMTLFSASYRAKINLPQTQHWPGMLMSALLVTALVAPIVVATLASRVAEIEHLGNGWTAAAVSGQRKGKLCLVKLIALAPLIVAWTAAQLAALVAASRIAGANSLPAPGQWALFGLTCAVITTVLLAGHLLLAASTSNQLAGLGAGVLGAFAGGFSLLMPGWLVRLIPWGYYALASPYRMTGGGYEAVAVPWGWLAGLLTLLAAVIACGYARLSRQEI